MLEETRELPCRLTADEIRPLAERLAKREIENALEIAAAKAAAAESRKRLKEIRKDITALSTAVDTGCEMRKVRCRHDRNLETNEIIVTRCDNGDEVERRPLTPAERQAEMFVLQGGTDAKTAAAPPPPDPGFDPHANVVRLGKKEKEAAEAELKAAFSKALPPTNAPLQVVDKETGEIRDATEEELAKIREADEFDRAWRGDAADPAAELPADEAAPAAADPEASEDAPDYSAAAEVAAEQVATGTRPEEAPAPVVADPATATAKKERKPVTCGRCGQTGHTVRSCGNAKSKAAAPPPKAPPPELRPSGQVQ